MVTTIEPIKPSVSELMERLEAKQACLSVARLIVKQITAQGQPLQVAALVAELAVCEAMNRLDPTLCYEISIGIRSLFSVAQRATGEVPK